MRSAASGIVFRLKEPANCRECILGIDAGVPSGTSAAAGNTDRGRLRT